MIVIQELHSIEEALRLPCRLEAIDSSETLEDTHENHRDKQKLHNVDEDLATEAGSSEINRQLMEMRKTLHNVRQELECSKVVSYPPLGKSVQGVGLSPAKYPGLVCPLDTQERYNLTGVRRQPVGWGMEGASGGYADACFNCMELGHWCRECPKIGIGMIMEWVEVVR